MPYGYETGTSRHTPHGETGPDTDKPVRSSASRVYVGNLPPDADRDELARVFEAIGPVSDVQIKQTVSNDWFAFVHFVETGSAALAVERLDGKDCFGRALRVELPFEARRRYDSGPPHHPRGGYEPREPYGRMDEESGYGRSAPPPAGRRGPRSRIVVLGLPQSGSWQDLKDHFREIGDCVYADVTPDGTGIVEFAAMSTARHAMDRLQDSEFVSHEGERSRITLELSNAGESSNDHESRPPPRERAPYVPRRGPYGGGYSHSRYTPPQDDYHPRHYTYRGPRRWSSDRSGGYGPPRSSPASEGRYRRRPSMAYDYDSRREPYHGSPHRDYKSSYQGSSGMPSSGDDYSRPYPHSYSRGEYSGSDYRKRAEGSSSFSNQAAESGHGTNREFSSANRQGARPPWAE